ncbi:MAG: hypothetical protein V1821_01765 [bacterium]
MKLSLSNVAKQILIGGVILGSLVLSPYLSLAAEDYVGGLAGANAMLETATDDAFGGQTLPELISSIINQAFALIGIIVLFYFLYGGYMWMTATGDTEKVTKAKQVMTQAVIGLIIILASYAIASFVVTALTKATEL